LLVNSGIVNYWYPKPLILQPRECTKLEITIEVDDLSQSSAFFNLLGNNKCIIPFSVPFDPKECMCSEVKILNAKCYKEDESLFYNIAVEICNTGTEPLHLDSLKVDSSYIIHHWHPEPFYLHPEECDTLYITVEVSDLSQTSALFTMFDSEDRCFLLFSVPLDPEKCLCGIEIETLAVNCHKLEDKMVYDIEVEVCNTSINPLNLDRLIVNSGYNIRYWAPQSITLQPGECINLYISLETDNFNQTSALFTLFDESNGCQIEFLVALQKCICRSRVEIQKVVCYQEDCKLFYDIDVVICNYGENTLNLDNLIVNNGYSIENWSPQHLIVQPEDCERLYITLEINDFTQTSPFFTLFDKAEGCYVEFIVNLEKWCIEGCDLERFNLEYDICFSTPQTAYFNFEIMLPALTDVLGLWVKPPSTILNYNYQPHHTINGIFAFDREYLEQMAANYKDVCIYAVVCIDSSYLCLVEICRHAQEIFDQAGGAMPMPAPPNMRYEEENETNTFAHSIKIYPNPAQNELFIVSDNLLINNIEIVDLAGKTVHAPSNSPTRGEFPTFGGAGGSAKVNVSSLPQGMYLIKIYTENGIMVKKFIKR